MRTARLLRSSIFRLALIYLSFFSLAVLFLAAATFWISAGQVSRQIDSTIEAEVRGLAEQFSQRSTPGLIEAIRRRSAAADRTRGLYLLTDPTGRPLAGNLSRWPDEEADEDGWLTFRLAFPDSEGGGVNFGRARTFVLSSGARVLVGHDVRERDRLSAQIGEILVFSLLAILGFSVIGGLLMSRALLRRIETINSTSRDIMAGDLGQRVPMSARGDEFDQLAGNLNAMLDQIERLLAGMRQVSDNIAHDLRSPLSRLRSGLELALIEKPGSAGYREAITKAIGEADDLLRTFTALLRIAQAEAGTSRDRFAKVDLKALVEDVVELYAPLTEDLEIGIDVTPLQAASRPGDRDLLFQALVNLMDNAIKFSKRGGRVGIGVERRGSLAVLSVRDRGPGIPEDQREQVLKRFVRLEQSRSTAGSGLGLSLVEAVAHLHGGRLVLGDNAPGLTATLELPLAPPERAP
ncbi:HAMP domain-containing sensor histidine kinase [Pelagibius sp.]|uniref:sensor histidine kinase n=1 Tax=Pelagibius sp. TaxID=1931238 RepID=UPI002632645E|nr:ATP-binding protein [Pelagibius sp.]